jgi:hypothetical protein
VTPTDIGIALLWITLIGSVAWSVSPETSITKLDSLIIHALIFAGVVSLPGRRHTLITITRSLLYVAGVLSAVGVIAFLLGELGDPLLFGTVSRNQYTRDMLAVFPLVVVGAYQSSGGSKLLYTVVASLMLVLIPASGSRSGLIAFVVVLLLLVMLFARTQFGASAGQLAAVGALTSCFFVLVLMAAIRVGVLPIRLAQIPTTPSQLLSPDILGPARYQVYQREFEIIRKNWLTGIGYAGFLAKTQMVIFEDAYQAHDLISRVWLAAGIGPVILLFSILVSVARTFTRAVAQLCGEWQMYVGAYAIGFAGLFTAGMANNMIYDVTFYILLAFASNLLPRVLQTHGTSSKRGSLAS